MSDRFRLFARVWKLDNEVRRIIVAIHGTGEHSGYFRPIAEDLSDRGTETFAPDLRGFGKSVEKGLPRGDAHSFKRHLADIHEAITSIHKETGEKIHVFGHSHGCATTLWYAANHPEFLNSIVLASPPVESTSKVQRAQYFRFIFALLFAPKTMYTFNTPASPGSEEDERFAILNKDPLAARSFSIRWLYGSKKMLLDPMFGHASRIQLPVLILQGEQDTVTLQAGATKLFQAIASQDKKMEVFRGTDHFLNGSIFPAVGRDSAGREQVSAVVDDWLKNHS